MRPYVSSPYPSIHSFYYALNCIFLRCPKTLISMRAILIASFPNIISILPSMFFVTSEHPLINRCFLVNILKDGTGKEGAVLDWLTSYLSNCPQVVKIVNSISTVVMGQQGVPQGSILSPTVFSLYMEPLIAILKKLSILYPQYNGDTQLYLKTSSINNISIPSKTLIWVSCNFTFYIVTMPNHWESFFTTESNSRPNQCLVQVSSLQLRSPWDIRQCIPQEDQKSFVQALFL